MIKKLVLALTASAAMIGSVAAYNGNDQAIETGKYKEELALISKYLELQGVEPKVVVDLVSKILKDVHEGASAQELLKIAQQEVKRIQTTQKPSFIDQAARVILYIVILGISFAISTFIAYKVTLKSFLLSIILDIIAFCLIPVCDGIENWQKQEAKKYPGVISAKLVALESISAALNGMINGTAIGGLAGCIKCCYQKA